MGEHLGQSNSFRIIVGVTAILSSLLVGACVNQSKTSSSGALVPSTGGGGGTSYTPPVFSGGATTALTSVNNIILSQYVGYPVTAATTIYLNVNTTNINGYYLGQVNIAFQDTNGVSHNAQFSSGLDTSHGNDRNILTTHSVTGLPAYRLFFEDPLGVIAVVIQNAAIGADNVPPSYNGEVYFRNFNSSAPNPLYQGYTDTLGNYWPPNPYAFCWSGQITAGPYDCRNFSTPPSTAGDKAFILLGSFTTLDKSALGQ